MTVISVLGELIVDRLETLLQPNRFVWELMLQVRNMEANTWIASIESITMNFGTGAITSIILGIGTPASLPPHNILMGWGFKLLGMGLQHR